MYRFRTLPESALSDCAAPVPPDAGLPPPPQALNKDRKPSASTAVRRPTSADPLINRDPFDVASALYIAARLPGRDLLRGAGIGKGFCFFPQPPVTELRRPGKSLPNPGAGS